MQDDGEGLRPVSLLAEKFLILNQDIRLMNSNVSLLLGLLKNSDNTCMVENSRFELTTLQ